MPGTSGSLHFDAVVVDCHNDLILDVERKRAFQRPTHFADYWVPELRAGGVDVQVLPIYVDDEYRPDNTLRRMFSLLAAIRRLPSEAPDDVALCGNGTEIDATVAAGKIALIPALESCEGIGTNLELFELFYALGVRMVSFTHFGRTAFGDGSAEDDTGSRLTATGVEAVGVLERLGIVMDVSHLGMGGTDHVLEIATRPVIASHSSARALCDHHRNLRDEVIKAIAATGGVVGVNFYPGFVDPSDRTPARVVDHICHVVSVAGIDHVGIGPDFLRELFDDVYANYQDLEMGNIRMSDRLEGLQYSRELPALTDELVARGFSETDVKKILGENLLRVFRDVMGKPSP
jgi:membrane dipeptidase